MQTEKGRGMKGAAGSRKGQRKGRTGGEGEMQDWPLGWCMGVEEGVVMEEKRWDAR
jgi:hypothetical protein